MALVEDLGADFLVHMDLHETTDSDENEFRPALAARDGKGLYGGCRRGAIRHVVGVDIPFTPPARPDLVFDVDAFGDLRAMAEAVADLVLPVGAEAAR